MRRVRAWLGVTRQCEPLVRSHRIGVPSVELTAKSCTLRAKSMRAYRPGDQTGICSSTAPPWNPDTNISIAYRCDAGSGMEME